MGVNTTMVKVLGFAVSAAFMGAAGVVTAPHLVYIDYRIAFGLGYSFMPILMSVFGGMGVLYGPVLGAAIFAFLEREIRTQLGEYSMLIFGAILVLVILFLPNGTAGLVPILQGKLRGVIARLRKGGQTEQHANT